MAQPAEAELAGKGPQWGMSCFTAGTTTGMQRIKRPVLIEPTMRRLTFACDFTATNARVDVSSPGSCHRSAECAFEIFMF